MTMTEEIFFGARQAAARISNSNTGMSFFIWGLLG
jgi:hypothetical protein